MISCICIGSHFLHRQICSSPGSSRRVPPKVAQKNLEEYYRKVKRRVDEEVLQHTKQKEKEGREVKEAVPDVLELPASEPSKTGGDRLTTLPKLSKHRRSKRWFKKFGAHSVEYSSDTSLSPYRDPTSKEGEKAKLPKTSKKWSMKGKGQHRRRELIELERCNSLVMASKQPLKRGSWDHADETQYTRP